MRRFIGTFIVMVVVPIRLRADKADEPEVVAVRASVA